MAATTKSQKQDNLQHEHLLWLVNSRTANQKSALSLHRLLDAHTAKIRKNKDNSTRAQALVAVCFSLWRAAFLADKTGVRQMVLDDAKAFLGKMLTDNAITYPQDRATREWTFNYYMNSAKDSLLALAKRWPEINEALSAGRSFTRGPTASTRRWDCHQAAFEVAIEFFRKSIGA